VTEGPRRRFSIPQLPTALLERGPNPQVPARRERHYSQSLDRGFAILGCFTLERPALGISDVAVSLGMSHATTHRYMSTLVHLGYLEQRRDRKYVLGLQVAQLGMACLAGTSVADHAHPHMQELAHRSGFTVALAVLDGAEIVYLERILGRRAGQRATDLDLAAGSRLPAHCTALGKLLLANLPDPDRAQTLASLQLERRTAATITSRRALRAQLQETLETGIAYADEELADGHRAIAAAVRDESGEAVAALSVTAHTSMIEAEAMRAQLGPHAIVTADRVSARLGYRRPDELPSR
jgi:IclR family transcriptional regulator, pca regulon regulatory protein